MPVLKRICLDADIYAEFDGSVTRVTTTQKDRMGFNNYIPLTPKAKENLKKFKNAALDYLRFGTVAAFNDLQQSLAIDETVNNG